MTSDILQLRLADVTAGMSPAGLMRPPRLDDVEALADAYFRAYPAGVGALDMRQAIREIRAMMAGEFGALRVDASFVADIDDRVQGGVFVTADSIWDADIEGPFIIDVFLAPRVCGRGLGRRLVEAAVHACARAGDAALSLRVGSGTSIAAEGIARSLGFRALSDTN